jgi:hypothetical protein
MSNFISSIINVSFIEYIDGDDVEEEAVFVFVDELLLYKCCINEE